MHSEYHDHPQTRDYRKIRNEKLKDPNTVDTMITNKRVHQCKEINRFFYFFGKLTLFFVIYRRQ